MDVFSMFDLLQNEALIVRGAWCIIPKHTIIALIIIPKHTIIALIIIPKHTIITLIIIPKHSIIALIIYALETNIYGLKRPFMALKKFLQNSEFIFDHMTNFWPISEQEYMNDVFKVNIYREAIICYGCPILKPRPIIFSLGAGFPKVLACVQILKIQMQNLEKIQQKLSFFGRSKFRLEKV